MYTGDGVGIVRIWNSRVRAGDTVAGSFVCLRTIEEKEMMVSPPTYVCEHQLTSLRRVGL